jgi:uncharacterized protein YuzE
MIIEYDAEAAALYVTLIESRPSTRTDEVSDSVLVDLDDDGALIGIEVLTPGQAWLPILADHFNLDHATMSGLADAQVWGAHLYIHPSLEERIVTSSTSRTRELSRTA